MAGAAGRTLPLICPDSRLPLYREGDALISRDPAGVERRRWRIESGIPDLIVGGRFEDRTDEAGRCYEVTSNTHTTEHYWVPLFRRLFPDFRQQPRRLLAVGCGIGVEVDLLCDAGFECFGVDNGNRAVDWPKRSHPEGLVMANGLHLPFEDGAFDAVFCGCVFPHVGVIGDSNQVAPDGWADRQRLASEMVRVTRRGGHVIACSPNRLFPFDIFHWRKPGCYRPALNPPGSRFLLSVADFRQLFVGAGAREVRALPVEGFWGFVTMRRSWKGRLFSAPFRCVFHLASRPAGAFLRATPLLPWITVGCRV